MTSKEALERIKKSHYIAMACMGIDKPDIETEKAIKTIEKELKELQLQYDKVCNERDELNKDYRRLKKDLLYLQKNGVGLYIFPNNRKILGIDITDYPSEVEIRKQILEDTIKNII